jgi:hypothetical protein
MMDGAELEVVALEKPRFQTQREELEGRLRNG